MPIKINGATSGSTTITAPASGGDETIELSTALGAKLPYAFGTATPTTTESGFLWYDSNSTPPVAKYWNGSSFAKLRGSQDFIKITDETFTSVSNLSINGCFTTDYRAYRIIGNIIGVGGGFNLRFRMRSSGTDNTTSNYGRQRGFFFVSTVGADSSTSNNIMNDMLPVGTNTESNFVMTIYNPAEPATHTTFTSHGGFDADMAIAAGSHRVVAAFDGITFITSSNTMTGGISIYGIKE